MSLWNWKKLEVDARQLLRAQLEPLLWWRDMGGAVSWRRARVYGITYPQLGDHWVGVTHLVRFRRVTGMRHRLSLLATSNMTTGDRASLVKEIARVLNVESEIEFDDRPPELELPVHPARNGRSLAVADVDRIGQYVAHQFDGISHPHLNPTAEEVDAFLGLFRNTDLRRIGRPLTLQQSMDVLKASRLFVGVSSGMSHLAASAGTPAFIFVRKCTDGQFLDNYKHLKRWNPYPQTRLFSDIDELKQLISECVK